MANHPHNSKRPESKAIRDALEAGDIDTVYHKLSVRQRRFAEEYCLDYNGKAAAIRAGYSLNHVDQQAHTLLKHKGISAYIDHLTRSKEVKVVSVNPDYVIQQVIAIVNKEGASDGNRLRGLELLARHLGMFIERTEITGKDGGPLAIEKVEEEARSFTNLLNSLRERALRESEDKVISILE